MSFDVVYFTTAISSRLYEKSFKKRLLSEIRISIKDNFALTNIKSTMMNRAYTELYESKKMSAQYVEKLIDLEATIVEKTKMCAFVSFEKSIDQWIDYHCSFNSRDDKYQSLSDSTTEGAATLVDYDWLDTSIEIDSEFLLERTYVSDMIQLLKVFELSQRAMTYMLWDRVETLTLLMTW